MGQAKRQPELSIFSGGSDIRTLADGLEQLYKLKPNLGARRIVIRVAPLRLPTGEISASVALTIPRISARTTLAFVLPTAARCYATNSLGLRQSYDTAQLNNAAVEPDGNVCLKSGIYLHNVELVPSTLRPELTQRQELILWVTIHVLQAEGHCLRPAEPHLPKQVRFDYGALPKEKLPILKDLDRRITKEVPDATRREIAIALAAAGMRLPRSGRNAAQIATS